MRDNRKQEEEKERGNLANQALNYLESNSSGAVMTKVLLATLAVGGIVCGGAVAPNIIKALESSRRLSQRKGFMQPRSVQVTLSRFKRDGLIQLKENKDGTVTVLVTQKGRKYVHDFTRDKQIQKPKIWDRKWRVVIFDVPVEKNRERQALSRKLKELGFRQIQKSVWLHPYKCEDEVLFIAKQLKVEKYMEILVVRKMLHEKKWKNLFFGINKEKNNR